jgi:hypothetical protein
MSDNIGRGFWPFIGIGGFVITKSNTVMLVDDAGNTKSYEDLGYLVYVGGTGDVKVTTLDGSTPTFVGVPAGEILPVICTQVFSTGTDATAMYAIKGA